MNKTIKFIITSAVILLLSLLLGVFLLTLAYSLPIDPIEENVKSSAITIENEGLYPNIFSWCTSCLDNYSDAIMLNTAAYRGSNSPMFESMKAHRYFYSYQYPDVELSSHYLKGIPYDYVDSYSRYWHGYLVLLKPLLCITDLGGIRTVNFIVQFLLVASLLFLLKKKSLGHLIVPFLLSYLLIMPIAIALSLQFSQCLYLLLIASIAITINIGKKAEDEHALYIFLLSGIATAYFTVLTYPLVTFGIPFIIFLASKKYSKFFDFFISFVKAGVCWCSGYALMWIGKWLVGTIITNENMFKLALSQAQSWTGSSSFSFILYNNVRDFAYTPFMILAVIYCVMQFVRILKAKTLCKTTLVNVALPYIIISLLPFAWYFTLQAHSSVHHFFTNKILMITAFGIMCMLSIIKSKTPSE